MGQPAPSTGGSGATRGGYAKGDARRELIVDVASEIFGTQGFRAATMLQIAAACGISRTGLLHHFPTKESLLEAVLARRDRGPTDPDGSLHRPAPTTAAPCSGDCCRSSSTTPPSRRSSTCSRCCPPRPGTGPTRRTTTSPSGTSGCGPSWSRR